MREPTETTGLDRIRRAIAQQRGEFAPQQPVTLCGAPDGTERRADSWERPSVRLSARQRVAVRLADALVCPGCLGLRFGPTHLTLRLLTGRH
jgi:hypothetical protein